MARPARLRFARPQPWAPSAAGLFALATLAAAVPAAWAQSSGLSITPTFEATQEFTDNIALSATNPKSEAITTVRPGIRITSWTGPLQGSLDLGLLGIAYARDPTANSVGFDNQTDLSASFKFEVVEQHAFIDAQASISQQSVSAFGLQSNRPGSINDNSTEFRTLTVSPYARGKAFDGEVDIEARLTSQYTNSSGDNLGGSSRNDASVSFSGGRGAVGWLVRGTRSNSDFDGGRATTEDRIYTQLSYVFDPTLRFFLSGGYERNDVLSSELVGYTNWGGGFSWQPTPRTQLSVQTEQRYFGGSWNVSLSHRMRRTVLVYTDSNSDNNATTGAGRPLSNYDLFFAQFASVEPDPARRDVLVRNFLRSAGLNPNERISGGFVSRAVTVTRSQNLSLALQGQRQTAVLSAFATSSRRADTLSTAEDDLSQVSRLNQQGVSLSLSHALTPTSSVGLFGSLRRTPDSDGVQGNDLRDITLSWSERVGLRTSVSVEGRHAQASGGNPYRENSVLARFNYRF